MAVRILRFANVSALQHESPVADTLGAAHALARHGDDEIILCVSGGEAKALAPLPLAALRIDDDVIGAARRLGIDRVGDLFQMPRAPLERRFGRTLLSRLDQALGDSGEVIEPVVPEDPPQPRFASRADATAEAIARQSDI